ncbi:MAG: YkvA family protein [Candidatus Dormibacteria bacterium]
MQLRLAYCLARDPRTPAPLKAALAGSLALILNPAIDLPAWVPVLGQMDAIALTLLALRTFNGQAPAELRSQIEAEIRAGESRFDLDLRRGTGAAGRLGMVAARLPRPGRDRSRTVAEKDPEAAPPWYRSPSATVEQAKDLVDAQESPSVSEEDSR